MRAPKVSTSTGRPQSAQMAICRRPKPTLQPPQLIGKCRATARIRPVPPSTPNAPKALVSASALPEAAGFTAVGAGAGAKGSPSISAGATAQGDRGDGARMHYILLAGTTRVAARERLSLIRGPCIPGGI